MRIAPHLAWQIVDGEGVIVDLAGRRVIGLNPTASLVLSLLDTHQEGAIAAEIARCFEVDEPTARNDTRDFLEWLRARGLAVAD